MDIGAQFATEEVENDCWIQNSYFLVQDGDWYVLHHHRVGGMVEVDKWEFYSLAEAKENFPVDVLDQLTINDENIKLNT